MIHQPRKICILIDLAPKGPRYSNICVRSSSKSVELDEEAWISNELKPDSLIKMLNFPLDPSSKRRSCWKEGAEDFWAKTLKTSTPFYFRIPSILFYMALKSPTLVLMTWFTSLPCLFLNALLPLFMTKLAKKLLEIECVVCQMNLSSPSMTIQKR